MVKKAYIKMATAGSVDDGKSTLIGRLLLDSGSVPEDILASIRSDKFEATSDQSLRLAHLADGLRYERERGITIDVAYRYFETENLSVVVADTPGHWEYTRNMLSGSSGADVIVVLVDALIGPTSQTSKHFKLIGLLNVPHVIVCVNKMDALKFSEHRFRQLHTHIVQLSKESGISDVSILPISALQGDNVMRASDKMPWYDGATLISLLEELAGHNHSDSESLLAMQVQSMELIADTKLKRMRLTGRIVSGECTVGSSVRLLPQSLTAQIEEIEDFEGTRIETQRGDSVSIVVSQSEDIVVPSVVVSNDHSAVATKDLQGVLFWMSDSPFSSKGTYELRAFGGESRIASIESLQEKEPVSAEDMIVLNSIVDCKVTLQTEVAVTSRSSERELGTAIIVDLGSGDTCAALFIGSRLS